MQPIQLDLIYLILNLIFGVQVAMGGKETIVPERNNFFVQPPTIVSHDTVGLNDICTLDSVYCDNSIEGIITKSALKYGVDPDLMIRIAKAESNLNPKAIGKIDNNDRGLFQISRRWHLKDDDACAFDPYCSSDWTANKIAMGGLNLWSASRLKWSK